jgi:hypothetical protein
MVLLSGVNAHELIHDVELWLLRKEEVCEGLHVCDILACVKQDEWHLHLRLPIESDRLRLCEAFDEKA